MNLTPEEREIGKDNFQAAIGSEHTRRDFLKGTLAATVDGLRIRAETHIDKMLKAQKQYDAGAQRAAA